MASHPDREGKDKERKNETWTHHKGGRGGKKAPTVSEREREREKKEMGRRGRRAGAEETLEMTACKYASGGALKWR